MSMAANLEYVVSVAKVVKGDGKWYIECAGPSTATKPGDDYLGKGIVTGSLALETDTGDVCSFQEGTPSGEWGKIASLGGGS